jgi:hypothetical protein
LRKIFQLCVLGLALAAGDACAQNLEPREYANTPIGLNFLIAGYSYSQGDVTTDPSLPLENADLQFHTILLGYARSLNVWGKSGKFDVIVPYVWLSGTAEAAGQPREREVSGPADPRFRFSVNLYGAPALSLKEFADYKQDIIIGVSLQVSAPLGQYDSDKVVNIGTNRWSFNPELGISKAWGPVTLELTPGVTFYTKNDDFLGGTREQDPLYAVQGHLIYNIGSAVWASVDVTYYTGGRTTIDGVTRDDRQENVRVGGTLALPVDRYNSVKLYASTGAVRRVGGDFTTVGIAWQYRWGGGL